MSVTVAPPCEFDAMVTVGGVVLGGQLPVFICGVSLESKSTNVSWWAGGGGLPVRITLFAGWIVSGKKHPLQPAAPQSFLVWPLRQLKPVGEIVPP
jgi:hypothetical protein